MAWWRGMGVAALKVLLRRNFLRCQYGINRCSVSLGWKQWREERNTMVDVIHPSIMRKNQSWKCSDLCIGLLTGTLLTVFEPRFIDAAR